MNIPMRVWAPVIIAIYVVISSSAFAQAPDIQGRIKWEQAKRAVEARDFASALQLYEEVIDLMGPYPELHYNAARAAYESREYEKAESYIMQALSTEDTEFQQTEEYGLAFELAASIKDGLEQQRQERVRQLEKQREDEQIEAQRLAAEQRQSMALQQAMQPYDLEQRRVQLKQFLKEYPRDYEGEEALRKTVNLIVQPHLSRISDISDLEKMKIELEQLLREYPEGLKVKGILGKVKRKIQAKECKSYCKTEWNQCIFNAQSKFLDREYEIRVLIDSCNSRSFEKTNRCYRRSSTQKDIDYCSETRDMEEDKCEMVGEKKYQKIQQLNESVEEDCSKKFDQFSEWC